MAQEKKPRNKALAWLLSSTKEQAKDTGHGHGVDLPAAGILGQVSQVSPRERGTAAHHHGLAQCLSAPGDALVRPLPSHEQRRLPGAPDGGVLPGGHPHRPHPPLNRRRRPAIEKVETGPGLGLHRAARAPFRGKTWRTPIEPENGRAGVSPAIFGSTGFPTCALRHPTAGYQTLCQLRQNTNTEHYEQGVRS